jgi:hypothetical protein
VVDTSIFLQPLLLGLWVLPHEFIDALFDAVVLLESLAAMEMLEVAPTKLLV